MSGFHAGIAARRLHGDHLPPVHEGPGGTGTKRKSQVSFDTTTQSTATSGGGKVKKKKTQLLKSQRAKQQQQRKKPRLEDLPGGRAKNGPLWSHIKPLLDPNKEIVINIPQFILDRTIEKK